MLNVKIYGNDGNIVKTYLDKTSSNKPPKHQSNLVYVTYGETPKSEMIEHIAHKDYIVCLYHMTGYNTAFLYPLVACVNYSHPGTEILEFVNDWVDGQTKHLSYNVATDTWSEH